MSALATVQELLVRLGLPQSGLSTEDAARAEAVLNDVSDLVREEAQRSWASPAETPAAVRTVVLSVARRVFANPEGYTSETAGPFTVRRDVVGTYLTDEEAAIVRKYRPGSGQPSGLWTQPVTRGEHPTTGFVWDSFGTEPIPYYDGL